MIRFSDGIQTAQYVHILICAFAFFLFIGLWLREKAPGRGEGNWYILFFALAILMWITIDIARFSFDQVLNPDDPQTSSIKWLFINIFSTFNNAFLLAALPAFGNAFETAKKRYASFRQATQWSLVIFTLNTLVVLLYILLWSADYEFGGMLISTFDVIYSMLTVGLFFYGSISELTRYQKLVSYSPYVLAGFVSAILVAHVASSFFFSSDFLLPRYITLYAYHIVTIIVALLFVTVELYTKHYLVLVEELDESRKMTHALEARLKDQKQNALVGTGHGNSELDQRRHLKLYMENQALVLELTMLDKGIIKAKIVTTTVSREYKDLLWFAIYRKTNTVVKSTGGAHKVFGDIYKSILDIRKRLINPYLLDMDLPALGTNELIIQRVKGSGVYELDCKPGNIEIDESTLGQAGQLQPILSVLTGANSRQ